MVSAGGSRKTMLPVGAKTSGHRRPLPYRLQKTLLPFILAPAGLACVVGALFAVVGVVRVRPRAGIRTRIRSWGRGWRPCGGTFPMSNAGIAGRNLFIVRCGATFLRSCRRDGALILRRSGTSPKTTAGDGRLFLGLLATQGLSVTGGGQS